MTQMTVDELRRKRVAGTASSAPEVIGKTACETCGHVNLTTRRFCSACGESLWTVCPGCAAEGLASDAFCGTCGASLRELQRRQADRHRATLQETRQLLAEHRYEDAKRRLQSLVGLKGEQDPAVTLEAKTLLERLDADRQQAAHRAAEAHRQARELLERQAYDDAIRLLMSLPAALRNDDMRTLVERARASQAEYLDLSRQLAEAVRAKRLLGQRATIDRVLQLKTADEQTLRLAQRLRDGVVKAAAQKLSEHRYDHALRLLDEVPAVRRDAAVASLRARAKELHWLLSEMQSAAVAHQPVLALAEKLRKLDPENADASQLYGRLQVRAAQPPDDPAHVAANWTTAHSQRLGFPVHWLGGLRRLTCTPAAAASLRRHPGRFFTAIGLALQGLEQAAVDINLAGADKPATWAQCLLRRNKPVRSAWGLDIGEAAVKAVRLACQDGEAAITVESVELLEHAKCLTQAVDESERSNLVKQTLVRLRQRLVPEETRVHTGLPSHLVLGRCFRLPPVPEKKLPDAVGIEARQQFPFALEELRWSYQAFPVRDDAAADNLGWDVIVEATRETQVEALLSLCAQAGWKIDGVQGECLALHNFLAHEYLAEDQKGPPASAIAMLDVGASSSKLLVSSPRTAWFRSLPAGGQAITSRLAQTHKLTHAQAEQLKRTPTAARRVSQLYETIDPFLLHLAEDVQRSLEMHARSFPNLKIRQMFGIGGGFALHGLLQRLRQGQ